jgi:aryl-alcohol dehydrogenase-like predicted oxidoreductase
MTVETFELAPGYSISRVLRGGWQLAGGHGAVDADKAVADMRAFVEAGVTTFDCADIYTGVEVLIGRFRAAMREAGEHALLERHKVHTKFVPDLDKLATIDRSYVERIIDRSRQRLQMDRLDLVQFHWWDLAIPGFERAAGWLAELAREGRIRNVGGTNFSGAASKAMLDAGVPLVSMQVQYSMLDDRPARDLAPVCAASGMKILCYGTIAGGFLTDRWLGAPEPTDGIENRSLIKYKLIIDDFGGWDLFQDLLTTLKQVGDRHGASVANVATRWVLDQPHVAGAIIGARYSDRLADNLKVFALHLDEADRAAIGAVLSRRKGPLGATYDLERDRTGRHGRIMKYNLNDI